MFLLILLKVKSEKDAYEKDISAYAKENQDLKEQVFLNSDALPRVK